MLPPEVNGLYEIGRLIRENGLDVYVTRTVPAKCGAAPDVCQRLTRLGTQFANPRGKFAVCASACVNILAAGSIRSLGPAALVGVHRASTGQQVGDKLIIARSEIPETEYLKMKDYLGGMGIDGDIIAKLLRTPNAAMLWLPHSEMLKARLVTDASSGEKLLTKQELDDWLLTPSQIEAITSRLETMMRTGFAR